MLIGNPDGFAPALLDWYDQHARSLPWRMPPGSQRRPDPYHVLVSEVMLQQTTVATVLARYHPFLEQFPDVAALAAAPEEDVLAASAGLGYYRRARSLHACSKALMERHGGIFPEAEEELRELPGIGDYTAAALAAIAFHQPAVVVDGNIERVTARAFAIEEPLPRGKKIIKEAAAAITPHERAGDFAQAMMDLGAGICRPKDPQCLLCPVRTYCAAQTRGIAADLPKKQPKADKKSVQGTMLVLTNKHDQVLCVRRPSEGLFAGMLGLPGGGWDGAPVPTVSTILHEKGAVEHILTHRRLNISVRYGVLTRRLPGTAWWSPEEARAAMPTLFKKALDRGLA